MKAIAYKIPKPFNKLTKKCADAIVKDLREGSHHKYAAMANGITERIFYIWVKQGIIDVELELDTLPAYFAKELANMKQDEIKKCRKNILESEKGHRGAEWTLEHAYWRQFSSNVSVIELAKEIEELTGIVRNEKERAEFEDAVIKRKKASKD